MRILFVCAVTVLILAVSVGCSPGLPPVVISPSLPQGTLELSRVIWHPDSLYFFGKAGAVNGTQLSTQLYKNNEVVAWWPSILKTVVQDGRWKMNVKASSWHVPPQLPDFEAGYSLHLWNEIDPSVDATLVLPFPAPQYTPTTDLKGNWKLISLGGSSLLHGTNITLNLGKSSQDSVDGNSNPNGYGGKYEADLPDKLFIYDLMLTLLGSPADIRKQENLYIRYLGDADTYKITGNHLGMYSDQQIQLLVFEKLP